MKQVRLGLPEIRRREWLLDLQIGKCESFAFACEAYSRILEMAGGVNARKALVAEIDLPTALNSHLRPLSGSD
jgi:hypothetical protein